MPDHWASTLPDTLTIDVQNNGVQQTIPLRDHPFVKDTPDLPTFVKRGFDAHREFGSRIPLKVDGPDGVAKWRQEHLPKLYQAGILEAPPSKPEEYGISRPEGLDASLWSDERAGKLASILHKHGVPKAAVPDLLALHAETINGGDAAFKISVEQGTAALKQEFGDKYDERYEQARRMLPAIFKTPEEIALVERLGLGNHPGFIGALMRLAPLAQADSSFLRDANRTGASDQNQKEAEATDIMRNKDNPKYKLFWNGDKATREYVEGLYREAVPGSREL